MGLSILYYAALVEAKLAVHQLQQLKSELESEVEQLRVVNRDLNIENESMSTSEANQRHSLCM